MVLELSQLFGKQSKCHHHKINMISIQILTFIISHAKCDLTSQNGDGPPACIIWFALFDGQNIYDKS